MKKVLAMGLILALCLCGCGQEQKAKVNLPEEKYDALVTMTEVVDSYLDMEITAEEASTKVEQLRARSNIEELVKTDDDPHLSMLNSNITALDAVLGRTKLYELQLNGGSTTAAKNIGEAQNELLELNKEIKGRLGIE